MALTEEQRKKKKELEAEQAKAIQKAASAFKSNPSSIPKKYQSQAKETSKKQEKYSKRTAKKNYSVGKNGSIKAKATKATKNYISGKSSNASGKKLTGTEKLRNSPGWNMTQEERFLKQRQYNRTKNDMSADKLDSKTWNAKDEAETRYTITGNYAKYAQQTARQAKENAEKYKKTGDAKYLDQAKEDANRARVFQQRMNSSVGNAVQAEKDFGFYLTSQKYDQYTRSTNPEYKAEAERRDAESRENFLKDRLDTARKNFALAELTSFGKAGKNDKLEAARKELKAAQKAYDEVKGKSKDKADKAEAAASETYTEMFKGLKAVTKPNSEQQAQLRTIQDEAERLAGLTETTETQQAEIQQFLKKYKTLPKVAQNQELINQMESKSGTATARLSNITSSALNQYAADVLRVPGMVDDAASVVMDRLNIDDTPSTDRAKKAEEATARAIKWMDKAADKFEGKASENREEAERGLGTIGKMGVDLGITLTQIGADAVNPIGATAGMATRVAGGVYNQVKESGADTDDALLNAGMHAAVEVLTERMFGLALPVYGRGSVDDLIEKAINKAAARVASKAGRRATKGFFRAVANFATEGGEELISAGFDPIIDAVTVGDKSDMKRYGTQEFWDDAMYQMVLGGVAGFVGGSVNQISNRFEDVDEKTLKEVQDKKAAKNFVPVEISDFSQSLINNGIKNKAAVNADTIISNLVDNEAEVTDKQINKMLDDLHITKKGAKTAGAQRNLTALKNRLGLTDLDNNISRADLVKAIREGARIAKQDKDMQTEADVRGMEEQAEAEQVRAEVDDAEATINENELKGRKILVPEEFGDTPITFDQFHEMITEDVPGITEDMIMSEWAGHVARNGINEEAPVEEQTEEEPTEEPTPVEEEQTEPEDNITSGSDLVDYQEATEGGLPLTEAEKERVQSVKYSPEDADFLRNVFGLDISDDQIEHRTKEEEEAQEKYNKIFDDLSFYVDYLGALLEGNKKYEGKPAYKNALETNNREIAKTRGRIKDLEDQLEAADRELQEARKNAANGREVVEEELPEDYNELAELEEKGKKQRRNQKFKELIREDSWFNGEDYQEANRISREARARSRELWEERHALEEELKSESSPKPKEEWTEEDEYNAILHIRPRNYTKRGEEILKRIEEIQKSVRALDQMESEANDRAREIKARASAEQTAQWVDSKPAEATQKEYEGFRTDTTNVPGYDQDLRNGKGYIAEMSPVEYLKRCAYDIFASAKTTLENQVAAVSEERIAEYTEAMANGDKFPMPYLNYGDTLTGQEGRHRAIAAYNLGIEKIPVFVLNYKAPNRINYETAEVADEFVERELDEAAVESVEEELSGNTEETTTNTEVQEETPAEETPTPEEAEEPIINPNLFTNSGKPLDEYITDRIKWTIKGASAEADADSITPTIMASFSDMLDADTDEVDSFISNVADSLGSEQLKEPLKYIFTEYKTHSQNETTEETTDTVDEETGIPDNIDFAYNEEAREQYGVEVEGPSIYDIPFALKPEEVKGKKMDILRKSVKNTVKDFGVKMTDEEVDQYAEQLNDLFRDFERGYREEEIRDPETGELYNVKRTNFRDPATQQEAVERFAQTLIDKIQVDNMRAINAYKALYSEFKRDRLLYTEEDANEFKFVNDRTLLMRKVPNGEGNVDQKYWDLMGDPDDPTTGDPDVKQYLKRAMTDIMRSPGVKNNNAAQNEFRAIILASQMMRAERTYNPFTDATGEDSQAYDYSNMVQMASVDLYKMFTQVPSEGDTVVGKGQKLARVVMDPRTNAARYMAFEQIQALEDALREVGATRPSFGKNLQRNNNNQVMSKEQTKRFEKSVLRDNEGNMFVLYPVGNNQYTTTPTSNISRLQASYGNVTDPAEVQGNFRSMEEIQDEVDRAMAEDGVDGVVVHNVKMGDYEGDIVIPKERSQMTSTIDYGISNAPVRQENRPENAFRPAGQEAPTKKDGYTKYIEALRAKVKAKTKMDDEALDLSISQNGLVENPGEWNPRKNVSGRTELKKGMDSAYNIIQSFREHFGLQIGKGSIFTQKASGYYNTQTWEIRTRVHNDLPTVCHELGHHLDRQYFKGALGSFMDTTKGDTDADKAFRELLRNSDQAFLSNYKQKDHSKEAFAEYIREYFLDSDATEMRFPEFTKYFMNSISTRDRVMMQTFADDINAFFSVTADTAQSEIISAKQLDDDFSSFRSRVGRKWNNFYQKMFDSNHAIKRFDEETGGKAHLLASIAPHSRERAANVLLRGVMDGEKYVGPGLVSVLKPIGKRDMADFNEYLVCKHGVERKAVKGEDYGVFADPRHNNTEWLQNRAAELEEKHPEFKHVSENLYQFINNVNEVWGVKTGLLSQDTVDAWNKQWQYYVPFQRRMEDDGKKSLKGSKNGFANQSAGVHSTRGGSGRQIIEPITSIENYVINLVNAGVRNNVMREITQTATMYEGNTAQFLVREREPLQKREVETDKFKQQLLDEVSANNYFAMDSEALGEIEDILEKLPNVITQYGRGRNSGDRVEVMVNGKPQTWRVTDSQLLESLVSMDPKTRNGALGIYQNCSRFIVGNITGNNILWALTSNFPRDLVTYYTFARTKNPIKLFGNLGASYVEKTKDLIGGQTSQYYEEYLAMGGGHTSYYSSDVGTNAKILEKVHPGVWTRVNPMNIVSAIADTIEFGPRYATYKLAREQGYTPEEAMFQAVDITVNFARGGTMARELNVLFPFFNASLQGVDKFARWISANEVPKDNRAHATVARTAGFFTASALAGALMWGINGGFDDDDEKKKHFAQLSNYTKNSFWTIPTSLFGSDKEGEYLCIPKAREINVLSSLITDALSYWENEDKEAFKEFKDYMSDNFLPSAGSAVVTMFTEDLGKGIDELLGSIGVAGPFFYIRANRDFLGRPIVPSYMLTSKEPQDIYKDTTTKLSKAVVDAVQKVAPNSFLKSVNPMQIDFFFQNTLGGWWKIYKALDPINPEYQDKLIGIKNQYFKYSTSSNDLVDSFYDKRDALTKKHGSSDSIDVAIQKKLYDNMATFYSGYNDMLKGMGKDEQRIAKQQMLDMMQSFMDSMDSGDYTSAQKDVFKFIRDNGLTDALPQGLKPELSYSLTKHGDYGNKTKTEKASLDAGQYYTYQTTYLNNYYSTMSGLVDSDWSNYEIEGMEDTQKAIKKKAAGYVKDLAKSTTDAQLASEWFGGESNDQNLLDDLSAMDIPLEDFAYLKATFQYMQDKQIYTKQLGEGISNAKQLYAASYIYGLDYTPQQKDWIWSNAVTSNGYAESTLASLPWNNGGVNGLQVKKASKKKNESYRYNYKYRSEYDLPGY